MKEETIQNIIDSFRGDYNMGTGFVTTSYWVQKNDEIMYNALIDKMWTFYRTEKEVEKAIEEFQEGSWLVRYSFSYDEYGECIIFYVSAGENRQALANQPERIQGYITIEDLAEDDVDLPINKYIKMLGDD